MFGFLQFFGYKGWALVLLITAGTLPAASEPVVISGHLPAVAQDAGPETGGRRLSVKECYDEANRLSSNWTAKVKNIQDMMAQAKKTKNVIRQNCIEPKVKDVDFGVEEGKTTLADMKGGLKSGINQDRMELLLQKMRVIDANIEEAVMEAGRCVGDEQFSSGDGFELKGTHPEETVFDPDKGALILGDPLHRDDGFVPTNPDWSADLTWPNASPYI